MKIGITGTQTPGPNAREIIIRAFGQYTPEDHMLIDGLCVGMDELVAVTLVPFGFTVHGACPANRYKVSQRAIELCTSIEYMPMFTSYMQRNDRIVELSDILIAFPKAETEELRSGTWATIRRARKKGIPVFIHPVGGS